MLWFAVGVATVLVALLAVPVAVRFEAAGIEPLDGRVSVRWMFGLLRFQARMASPPGNGDRQERAPERSSGRAPLRVLALLGRAELRQRSYRLARDLLRAAHPQALRLHLRVGLGDPADTGQLWAVLGPLSAVLAKLRTARVAIVPDFAEAALDFRAEGRLRVVPLRLVVLLGSFSLSPPVRRAWRATRAPGGAGP